MDVLDIAEVAQQSGLPASTLRYYEERGLIESIGRRLGTVSSNRAPARARLLGLL